MSWYPPQPKRLPGSGPWRSAGKRPFGATWWGKAWVDALEQRARLDPNRLPRGRTYARTGAVGDLEVHPGEIVAFVQGSRAKPYKVTVRVRAYSDKEWERTLVALASQVGHLAALLDGELPPGVAAAQSTPGPGQGAGARRSAISLLTPSTPIPSSYFCCGDGIASRCSRACVPAEPRQSMRRTQQLRGAPAAWEPVRASTAMPRDRGAPTPA
jgi:hypothetical protein